MALVSGELAPVAHVLAEVHLLRGPVAGLRLLVELEAAVVPARQRRGGGGERL